MLDLGTSFIASIARDPNAIAIVAFGSMPHHLAERNMRLFGDEVLPVLQRDAAFQGLIEPAPLAVDGEKERLFAPA